MSRTDKAQALPPFTGKPLRPTGRTHQDYEDFWYSDINFYATSGDLLRDQFWRDCKEDAPDPEELWRHAWASNSDPCRILQMDYRVWDKKYVIYTDHHGGTIAAPRYKAMRIHLPWFWWFTLRELWKVMPHKSLPVLQQTVGECEARALHLPLNGKWVANFNLWRVAYQCMAELQHGAQGSLFGGKEGAL